MSSRYVAALYVFAAFGWLVIGYGVGLRFDYSPMLAAVAGLGLFVAADRAQTYWQTGSLTALPAHAEEVDR